MKETRKYLAERADRVSRSLEQDAVRMLRTMLRQPLKYANVIVDADNEGITHEEFSRRVSRAVSADEKDLLTTIGNITGSTPGEDVIQLVRWSRNRVVFVVDPDTADAVRATEWGETVIPGEVLRRLPYTDPMVVLPEPFRVPAEGGVVEKYEAFLVLGVRPPRRRASTHDPETTQYVLHFLGRIVDPITDKPVQAVGERMTGEVFTVTQVVGMRVITPLTDMTMEDRKKYAEADIARLGAVAQIGFHDEEQALQVTREMTELALSLLVYLVTDDVDSEATRLHGQRRGSAKKGKKSSTSDDEDRSASETTVVEVGYRIGAALRASHHDPHASSLGTGRRTVSPHMRRAHIHTFRRGKGRQERFLRWLPPIPVGWKNGQTKQPTTQIHFPR